MGVASTRWLHHCWPRTIAAINAGYFNDADISVTLPFARNLDSPLLQGAIVNRLPLRTSGDVVQAISQFIDRDANHEVRRQW
jgi:hypothetical protein